MIVYKNKVIKLLLLFGTGPIFGVKGDGKNTGESNTQSSREAMNCHEFKLHDLVIFLNSYRQLIYNTSNLRF